MGSAYQSAGGGGAGASPAGKSVPTIPASVAGASSPGLQCPIAACSGEQAGSAGAVSVTSGVQCPIPARSGGPAAAAGLLALVAPLGVLAPRSLVAGSWHGLYRPYTLRIRLLYTLDAIGALLGKECVGS